MFSDWDVLAWLLRNCAVVFEAHAQGPVRVGRRLIHEDSTGGEDTALSWDLKPLALFKPIFDLLPLVSPINSIYC